MLGGGGGEELDNYEGPTLVDYENQFANYR